jgi:peptidoglycan/LPS O-acetylase OafA/YrhL
VKYRADIDGLRAVAVLSVIWFHYGASLPDWAKLPGGFTGVDVFFVISGFLITQQLYADIQAGRFSVLNFYDRRIRRILPALLIMLAIVLLAGRWTLMPGDYMSLAASTGAAAFGASNFYFLLNTGYFDQSAELMPLLHTWSLGVEEQFYIVWPVLLLWLSGFGGRKTLAAITTGIIVAGFAAMLIWRGVDSKVAFYMVGPRAWELASGALLVFLPPLSRLVGNIAVPTGVALIAIGFVVATATAFPGPSALLPCLGAALIIWPRATDNASATLLGRLKPIGTISYSLYLWHWPVWVMFRIYINNGVPSIRESVVLFAASVALAMASYLFVEQPLRRRRWNAAIPVQLGLTACTAIFCAAMYIHSANGLPSRIPDSAYALRSLDAMWDWDCPRNVAITGAGTFCNFGGDWKAAPLKGMLWGDSHADHMAPIVQEAVTDTTSIVLFRGCAAVLGAGLNWERESGYQKYCSDTRHKALALLNEHPEIKLIILSASWSTLAESLVRWKFTDLPLGIGMISTAFKELLPLLETGNRRVVIVADVPSLPADPIPCVLSQSSGLPRRFVCEDNQSALARTYFDKYQEPLRSMFSSLRSDKVTVVFPENGMCEKDSCVTSINGEFIYRDVSHIRRNLKPETRAEIAEMTGLTAALAPNARAETTAVQPPKVDR